ncbi:hypothetical protein DFH07DRAFT_951178 [Mycena maculata]|uniref:DUF6534 domain-containing protein n=1 Tax=Mycena maculata TaxID=230809 RepID=A0AAD7K7Y9_9AGAR|nr:hypothetical protein DFH07DRAFT_951178 [Mycena maculata]
MLPDLDDPTERQLIGVCIELVLQGILSAQARLLDSSLDSLPAVSQPLAQFVKYFGTYRDDPLAVKILVGILVLMTYSKSMQAFTVIWFQMVVNCGDLMTAIELRNTSWVVGSSPVASALIVVYVQHYFCFRFFNISKKWYLAAPLTIIFIVRFVANAIACYYNFQGPRHNDQTHHWFRIYVIQALVEDILLTSGTAYFLVRHRRNVTAHSLGVINALIRITFKTAAPSTFCSLINFVFSLTFPIVLFGSRASSSIATDIVFPKLNAVSMMWVLNARQAIRVALNSYGSDAESAVSALNFRARTDVAEPDPSEASAGLGRVSEKHLEKPVQFAVDENDASESIMIERGGREIESLGSCASTSEEVAFAPPQVRGKAWESLQSPSTM